MERKEIKVNIVETKSVMTKSNAPLGGYAVNPYVGCPHACQYCYASFMKRFTGHTEEWGTFMDVKVWPEIANPRKYAGQKVIIGTVTDGYNPLEETYGRTRKILEELKDSGADILICTKSDLVLRDMDLLLEINKKNRLTVSWSVNTLDESFKDDMDAAVSIERRLAAMKQVYDSGIRTVCFISPVFPCLTDIERRTNAIWFGWRTSICGAASRRPLWITLRTSTPIWYRSTTRSTTRKTVPTLNCWKERLRRWRGKTDVGL